MAHTEKFAALNAFSLPDIIEVIRELKCEIEEWSEVIRILSPPRIDMAIVWGISSPSLSKEVDHKPSYSLRLILETACRLRDLLNPSRRTAAHYNKVPEIEESDLPKAARTALRKLFAETDNPQDWLEKACADPDKWTAFLDEIANALEHGASNKTGPLSIDGNRVLVNGKPSALDMTANRATDTLTFLATLIAENGNWISSTEIDKREEKKSSGRQGVRWDRIRKELPAEIAEYVESNRRKGYRIRPA